MAITTLSRFFFIATPFDRASLDENKDSSYEGKKKVVPVLN
jgi:hypothetical protein